MAKYLASIHQFVDGLYIVPADDINCGDLYNVLKNEAHIHMSKKKVTRQIIEKCCYTKQCTYNSYWFKKIIVILGTTVLK